MRAKNVRNERIFKILCIACGDAMMNEEIENMHMCEIFNPFLADPL